MKEQPTALRLAELLEHIDGNEWRVLDQSAAELRRLHEAEEHNRKYVTTLEKEVTRLHEANQAMLEALKQCTEWMESVRSSGDAGHWDWYEGSTYTNGLAAIAKGNT